MATIQPSVQPHLVQLRAQTLICGKALPNPWKLPEVSRNVGVHHIRRSNLVIAALATLEKSSVQREDEEKNLKLLLYQGPSNGPNEATSDDSGELDERERLRRMRISKANRGNTPWNKGRKHSPETLQKIRERTKLAMQNPKVKMKLASLGHAQSEETKLKISVGVRRGWEKRREKLMVQETCHSEWQNLIAEAARRGCSGEEELQWDSYRILNEQHTKEWLASVEQRKTAKPKGSKRAPKSAEQRRKIAEAIAAKWADPAYRERVCSGLAKYHGIPAGSERKSRRKSSATTGSTKKSAVKTNVSSAKKSSLDKIKDSACRLRLRRSNVAVYQDPLASSKLEMLKDIRAQRAAAESKRIESMERARLLIVEAKKAAKALEIAATKSPVAQASLAESRKLIAEATQLIESIESGQATTNENDTNPSSDLEKETSLGVGEPYMKELARGINEAPLLFLKRDGGLDANNLGLQGKETNYREVLSSNYDLNSSASRTVLAERLDQAKLNGNGIRCPEPNGTKIHHFAHLGDVKIRSNRDPDVAKLHLEGGKEASSKPINVTKKWVRGRLVEVTEGV